MIRFASGRSDFFMIFFNLKVILSFYHLFYMIFLFYANIIKKKVKSG